MNRGSENTPIWDTVVTGTIDLNNASDTAFPDVPCEEVLIRAHPSNTQVVYINSAASQTTGGFPLSATDAPIRLRVDNLSRIGQGYAGAASQKLRYLVLK